MSNNTFPLSLPARRKSPEALPLADETFMKALLDTIFTGIPVRAESNVTLSAMELGKISLFIISYLFILFLIR